MYERLTAFAQFWGLVTFVGGFVLVMIYALWPGNKALFREAAEAPLNDDEGPYLGPLSVTPKLAADGASEESTR